MDDGPLERYYRQQTGYNVLLRPRRQEKTVDDPFHQVTNLVQHHDADQCRQKANGAYQRSSHGDIEAATIRRRVATGLSALCTNRERSPLCHGGAFPHVNDPLHEGLDTIMPGSKIQPPKASKDETGMTTTRLCRAAWFPFSGPASNSTERNHPRWPDFKESNLSKV